MFATEVYDFLLQTNDGEDLDSFCVASPHFCRTQLADGDWADNVHLLEMNADRTGWGWFYYDEGEVETRGGHDWLTLKVPCCEDKDVLEALELSGELPDLRNVSIKWHTELADSESIGLMQEIKKSLYQVNLEGDQRIRAGSRNRMWFRLLVEPAELSVSAPRPIAEQSFLDECFPVLRASASITCPVKVRAALRTQLNNMRAERVRHLKTVLLRDGIDMPGTSTRVEEHRIVLAGHKLQIDTQGHSSKTVKSAGFQPLDEMNIPPFGNDYGSNPNPECESTSGNVHHWYGGSNHNEEEDLMTVAILYHNEATMTPKPLKELVQTTTPGRFREGCFLANMLGGKTVGADPIRLLDIDPATKECRGVELTPQEFREELVKVRKAYRNEAEFAEFPEARAAFRDCHAFRIDFSALWTKWARCRRLVLWAGVALTVGCAVLGVILGAIGVWRSR